MGLFRRSTLEEVGGWNEWCISEDTEASVRVLKAGWSGGIPAPAASAGASSRPPTPEFTPRATAGASGP